MVRSATLHDAPAIAEVHLESYRNTYAGIFPLSAFDKLSLQSREQLWTRVLTEQAVASRTLVACTEDGSIVGFISGGRERTGHLNCDAEVYAIYLLPSAQRRRLERYRYVSLRVNRAISGLRLGEVGRSRRK
jgi:hypothetical protein